MSSIIPIIMGGGAGTRLWPASRETMPKQFIPLFGDLSTFQMTALRFRQDDRFAEPVVVAHDDFRFIIAEQLRVINMSARIVLDTRRDVLMVERGPFLEQDGGRFAYVVDGSRAVRRPIRTGTSSLGAVEVVEGLQPGERIVVSGSEQFDGAERVVIN